MSSIALDFASLSQETRWTRKMMKANLEYYVTARATSLFASRALPAAH
jgi:hypothetical protein